LSRIRACDMCSQMTHTRVQFDRCLQHAIDRIMCWVVRVSNGTHCKNNKRQRMSVIYQSRDSIDHQTSSHTYISTRSGNERKRQSSCINDLLSQRLNMSIVCLHVETTNDCRTQRSSYESMLLTCLEQTMELFNFESTSARLNRTDWRKLLFISHGLNHELSYWNRNNQMNRVSSSID
jgi:hypothetical protein